MGQCADNMIFFALIRISKHLSSFSYIAAWALVFHFMPCSRPEFPDCSSVCLLNSVAAASVDLATRRRYCELSDDRTVRVQSPKPSRNMRKKSPAKRNVAGFEDRRKPAWRRLHAWTSTTVFVTRFLTEQHVPAIPCHAGRLKPLSHARPQAELCQERTSYIPLSINKQRRILGRPLHVTC